MVRKFRLGLKIPKFLSKEFKKSLGGDCLNLSLEYLRLSNPTPKEGEEVLIEAKIKNYGKRCKFNAVFYWAPEIILSNDQMENFTKPEYEVYREEVEIPENSEKIIRFNWKVKKNFACMFVKPENYKVTE